MYWIAKSKYYFLTPENEAQNRLLINVYPVKKISIILKVAQCTLVIPDTWMNEFLLYETILENY